MRFEQMVILLLSITVLSSSVVASAQARPPAQPAGESFTVLAQGTTSAIDRERFAVIRDEAAFKALWNQHNAGVSPTPPVPEVNFSKDMVIAGFAGTRDTGGYVLRFDALLRKGNDLEARLTLMQPSNQCMVAQMMTAPFVLVTTHRNSLRVSFKRDTKISPQC